MHYKKKIKKNHMKYKMHVFSCKVNKNIILSGLPMFK